MGNVKIAGQQRLAEIPTALPTVPPASTPRDSVSAVLSLGRFTIGSLAGIAFVVVSPFVLTLAISALIGAIAIAVVILACKTEDPNTFVESILKSAVDLCGFPGVGDRHETPPT
jgi:hypothetical protein